jgi:hypothetical protein
LKTTNRVNLGVGSKEKAYSNRDIRKKSEKHSTSTLSLVIHRVRLKRNLQKSTLAFREGAGSWAPDGCWVSQFTLSFFFPERLECLHRFFNCSYLYSYYNSSRTLCIALNVEIQHFVLSFSIAYWDLRKFLTLWIHTKRERLGVKGGPKTGWSCNTVSLIYSQLVCCEESIWLPSCKWSPLCVCVGERERYTCTNDKRIGMDLGVWSLRGVKQIRDGDSLTRFEYLGPTFSPTWGLYTSYE